MNMEEYKQLEEKTEKLRAIRKEFQNKTEKDDGS